MLLRVVICTWTLVYLCSCHLPFNVDLQHPIVFRLPLPNLNIEPRSQSASWPSLFGSSVVAIKSFNREQHVFIGAPNFRSKLNASLVPGAIFQCELQLNNTSDQRCSEVLIDENVLDLKNASKKALMGFTLGTTRDHVVACAPNFVGSSPNKDTPVGVCLAIQQHTFEQSVIKYSVDSKSLIYKSRPYESHNLFGFSLAHNKDTDEIYFGTPGFQDFSGSVCVMNNNFQLTKIRNIKSSVNTYLGYSTAYFELDGMHLIVAGSPKFNYFNGKVDLVDIHHKDTVRLTLEGQNESKGEYFGASLVVADVNGDRQDDILVGAPQYSSRTRREIGRVYLFQGVYFSLLHGTKSTYQLITPRVVKSGSRFGTSIASINLNHDQYADIVIGAPFEDNSDGSTGAIYLYYGTTTGLDIKSEKRIGSETFASFRPSGFGQSLWTESDVDANQYNDLIIGSVLSEQVFLLRSSPLVNLSLRVEFDRKGVNLSDYRSCNNVNPCFRVHYCIGINWISSPVENLELTFLVNCTVSDRKIRVKENRVAVIQQSSIIKVNNAKREVCLRNEESFYMEVKKKEDIYDIITPIEIKLSAQLQRFEWDHFCPNCPIATPVTTFREIGFEHGCATKQCVAKLLLSVDLKYGSSVIEEVLVEGQYPTVDINANIVNQGESSIDTMLYITIEPPSVLFLQESADFSRCSPNANNSLYVCDINRLLQKNQREQVVLRFGVAAIHKSTISFDLSLDSASVLDSQSLVQYRKEIAIRKEVRFNLIGNEYYNYSFSDLSTNVLFPILLVVDKNGPSTVNTTHIQFYLPNNIIELKQSKHKCIKVRHNQFEASKKSVRNRTLNLMCHDSDQECSLYQCKIGHFETGQQRVNFDLQLAMLPRQIPTKVQYDNIVFELILELMVEDRFVDSDNQKALLKTTVHFERQISLEIKSKSDRLFMFGGAGIGLLILTILLAILIKQGFFKHKKVEEYRRVQQRMSMNPNLVIDESAIMQHHLAN